MFPLTVNGPGWREVARGGHVLSYRKARERASLLCPIRWRKEPCDSQQRNEDQNANRKVIDHVRKTRGHLLRSKAVVEDQAQRPLSARCLWRDLKRKLRVSWRAPFLIVWRLPKQRKDFRDRHHVLELFPEKEGSPLATPK